MRTLVQKFLEEKINSMDYGCTQELSDQFDRDKQTTTTENLADIETSFVHNNIINNLKNFIERPVNINGFNLYFHIKELGHDDESCYILLNIDDNKKHVSPIYNQNYNDKLKEMGNYSKWLTWTLNTSKRIVRKEISAYYTTFFEDVKGLGLEETINCFASYLQSNIDIVLREMFNNEITCSINNNEIQIGYSCKKIETTNKKLFGLYVENAKLFNSLIISFNNFLSKLSYHFGGEQFKIFDDIYEPQLLHKRNSTQEVFYTDEGLMKWNNDDTIV